MSVVNLFNWKKSETDSVALVKPWKPEPLDHEQWPPNYRAVYAWRLRTLEQLRADPSLVEGAKAYYASRPAEFIMHWMDTYNPRKSETKWMPFVFFSKQLDVIRFFEELRANQQSGLIEKCRDAGATWLACGYSVHSFLFIPYDSIGWGSRKAMLVDELGNPDSIFEKMRLILRRLPAFFLPDGWNEKKHAVRMRFVNPENGASINGEAGDNIGRGGRKSIYFKDESAHYERPEKIESALGDNTNVQIDISSVNGLGNIFHKRRQAGVNWEPGQPMQPGFVQVLVIDWRDHPEKTQAWYDARRAKHEREGMLHIFAQEVDRDYASSLSGVIIPREWLMSCIDAHIVLGWGDVGGNWIFGLDVADGGIDRNGLVGRQDVILRHAEEWGERDPGVTTRRTVTTIRSLKRARVMYDSIGVGSSVKSEFNRLVDEKLIDKAAFPFVAWNAGGEVQDPRFHLIPDDENSILNEDMFFNIKAQAWWSFRIRVYKTWRMVQAKLGNGDPVFYPRDELISIDSKIPIRHQLIDELGQAVRKENTSSLKMVVDKQPDGTKSPNVADAAIMAYFPIEEKLGALVGGTNG